MSLQNLGYDTRRSSYQQLKELLGLSDTKFKEINRTVKSFATAILDVKLQAQDQSQKLSEINDKLQIRFPEVFDSSKKLAFAKQLVMQYHRRSRRLESRRTARSSAHTNKIAKKSFFHRAVPERREISNLIGKPDLKVATPKPIKPQVLAHSAGAENLDPNATFNKLKSAQKTVVTQIYGFLHGCCPPLEHYLLRFVDLGFRSPEMLRDVALNWTADERRTLLKRVAPGPNGEEISELELVALERAFNFL